MTDYFSGKQLLKRWGLRDFELFKIVCQGKLVPHDKFGRRIPHPYYRNEEEKKLIQGRIEFHKAGGFSRLPKNVKLIKSKPSALSDALSTINQTLQSVALSSDEAELARAESLSDKLWGWFNCRLPSEKAGAEKIIQIITTSLYHRNEVEKIDLKFGTINNEAETKASVNARAKRVSPVQRHKERCREVAARLWAEDPSITIAGMILEDEIFKACDEKMYAERTIRNWINDLCPNRKPGRRPKNQ